ncbi:UCH and/or zf-UBP domain containing protein, partial [Asbolus verrucosus]
MSKKKHQGDPNGDESTESCDENDNMSECRHIGRAVDLQKVKKALIKTGLLNDCEQCQKMPKVESDMDAEFEFDNSLWLCLRCGNQACGRSRNKHALQHYNTPHSDSHAICVDTSAWSVWCYDCDEVVNVTCKKKLLEAVEYLQKQADNKNNALSKPAEPSVMDLVPVSSISNIGFGSTFNFTASSLPRPRGLMNLGNTCFFNSVVQCLAQTPYLLHLLMETSEPGQFFQLPGGKLNPQDNNSSVLEPLTGCLEKWRVLTSTLAETIIELQNGRNEAYVPRMLLLKLTNRMPQFGGGDQHDSHELLRHLLEAVREEDLRRYQLVILEKLGFSPKTDPSTVEGEKKKITKFYGQQASEMLLPTEQVFRGILVSTLQCQECQHTSHRDEFFLDLSLPITEKQLPPVLRRKAEEIDDNKPSKHQIKKEKRAERKKNKKQKSHRNMNVAIGPNQPSSGVDVNMDKSDSESDADVEDNAEVSEEATKGMESGYNSDKVDNSSPDSNNRGISPEMRIDDSGVPSPAIGMLSASHGTPDNSPASSETNIDMGSPLGDHCSPEE